MKEMKTIEDIKKALGECELYANSSCGEYLTCGYKDLESTICEAFESVEVYEEDIEEDTEFECLEIHACRYLKNDDISGGHGNDILETIKERLEEDYGIEDFDYEEKQEKSLDYVVKIAIEEWAKNTKVMEEKYYVATGKSVIVDYDLAKKISVENTVENKNDES